MIGAYPSVVVARRLCFCREYEAYLLVLVKVHCHFTVRYVVAKCCHYQHITVIVLESLAIRSRGLLPFERPEVLRDRKYPGLPYSYH